AAALRVATDTRPAKGRPPLRPAPPPLAGAPWVASCGLAAGGWPLQASRWWPSLAGAPLATAPVSWPQPAAPVPAGGRPLRAIAPEGGRPLQVVGSPHAGGALAATGRPYRGGRGWTWLAAPLQGGLSVAGCSLEIVYPCIPDPDREDEGGQASSSLTVSTRWISAAKLLQSDLATLVQREGGE
ncbi:hypothetical protein GW17_00053859, partial [Ensete ventricosum]